MFIRNESTLFAYTHFKDKSTFVEVDCSWKRRTSALLAGRKA
jgi:hypothetical protein